MKKISLVFLFLIPLYIMAQRGAGGHDEGVIVTTAALTNYPNSFATHTTIQCDIPEDARVMIKVFNSHGQVVAKVLDQAEKPGVYRFDFCANNLPSGIYFCYMYLANSKSVKMLAHRLEVIK